MKKRMGLTTGQRMVEKWLNSDRSTLRLSRLIDSALKRAVREGYDAGWEDGMSHGTNAQNDGWNRLARKYGMKEVL